MGLEDDIQRKAASAHEARDSGEAQKRAQVQTYRESLRASVAALEPHAQEFVAVLKKYKVPKNPIFQYNKTNILVQIFWSFDYVSRTVGRGWHVGENFMLDEHGQFWLGRRRRFKVRTRGPGGEVSFHRISSRDQSDWQPINKDWSNLSMPSLDEVRDAVTNLASQRLV